MNKVGVSVWALVAAFGAMTVAACGSPAVETGRDKKSVQGDSDAGSPNDPGWVPPGAQPTSPDDTTAQPGTGSEGEGEGEGTPGQPAQCDTPVADPTIPNGWKVSAFSTFSVASPGDWPVIESIDHAGSDPTGAFFEVFSTGAPTPPTTRYVLGANENASRTTLDAEVAAWHAVLEGKGGHNMLTFDVTKTTFGCDPAVRIHAVRVGLYEEQFVFAVLHDGHVFDVDCSAAVAQGSTPDTSLCATYLDTFRLAKK